MGERQLNSSEYDYRADVFRPLIYTCRALRAIFISAYYGHVEICIVRAGDIWYKHLAERLERIIRMFMDPRIREFTTQVKCVSNNATLAYKTANPVH